MEYTARHATPQFPPLKESPHASVSFLVLKPGFERTVAYSICAQGNTKRRFASPANTNGAATSN